MAKTLAQGFDTLIGWLKPLDSEHQKAAFHRASVQRCMENNFGCTHFFETGSFGNGTGVRHYSDTDYFARCPDANFYSDSGYTLRKVKEALQSSFVFTSGIEVKTPAVRIPFGNYASERLELTPAKYAGLINTPVGQKYSYSIPNYEGGWMNSSPGAHNAYVEREDIRLGRKLKPLIQLVKAWKFYNNVPITSFYLELRVTKYAEGETTIVFDIDVRNITKALYDNSLADMIDPMGISGYVKACKTAAKKTDALSKLSTGFVRADKANDARKKENISDAFYWWNLFYANNFPSL